MDSKELKERAEEFYGKLYRIELDGETRGFKERPGEWRGDSCLRFIVAEFKELIEEEREACMGIVAEFLTSGDRHAAQLIIERIRARSNGGQS
jgi:hypothetical protein